MDEHDLDPDPLRQFTAWFEAASEAGVAQPEAMALATAGASGRPSVRIVLLRGVDERGFVFFTNRDSAKAHDLAESPHAALVFHWQPVHRQVRVEGAVEVLEQGASETYFATRPRGAQLAAWASPQSQPVADRRELERLYAEAERRFAGGEVPLPPFWGGYRVLPRAFEFWQGRENRFHDRARYERTASGWVRARLAP